MDEIILFILFVTFCFFLIVAASYDSYAKKHKFEIADLNRGMNTSISLDTYFENRDQMIKHLEYLKKGEIFISRKNKINPKPSVLLSLLTKNYDESVTAAIKRLFCYYKDRSYEQEFCFCDFFGSQIKSHKSRLSEAHILLAKECYDKLRIYGGEITELTEVDKMEGLDFEYWCADLLRKNGFSNVEVTQGSGDQGVDVLAKKDGISYAIQCKCYSHDLGNTPVQEINTGKAVYRCQIGAVMTNRYFTEGAKTAAEATGVLLWDRDKLIEMLDKQHFPGVE